MSISSANKGLYVHPRTCKIKTRRREVHLRQFDVVAIHGSGGSRDTTWTFADSKRRVMWLTDLLPSRIDDPTIMTYDYEISTGLNMKSEIMKTAHDLLEGLHKQRQSKKSGDRPLIFVGHDIGGVIIKAALSIAIQKEKFASIAAKTLLLIFFGTPHTALNDHPWERAAAILLSMAGHNNHGSFIKPVKELSQALKTICYESHPTSRIYKTVSIFEQGDDHDPSPVIDKDMACCNIADVKTMIGLQKKHFELCRLESESAEVFKIIGTAIDTSSEVSIDYINLLGSLGSFDSTGYTPHIAEQYRMGLKELQSYSAWDQWEKSSGGHDQILMIHGYHNPERSALASWAANAAAESDDSAIIIGFAYLPHDDRFRSTHQMYASLSRQLLCLKPSLFNHVSLLYQDIMTTRADEPNFKLDRLWSLFRSLVSCPRHGKIICIVADIDACEPSRAKFLWELYQVPGYTGSNFKLIVTSTKPTTGALIAPFDNIIDLGEGVKTGEEIRDAIQDDIGALVERRPLYRNYVHQILEIICRRKATLHEARLSLEALGLVEIRSAHSAVEGLLKCISDTESVMHHRLLDVALKERLEGRKSGGEALEEPLSWTTRALWWIVNAARPLTVEEISEAVAFEEGENNSPSDIKARTLTDAAYDLEHALGGFVEVKNGEISLIHPCWRDYLIAEPMELSKISGVTASDFHAVMARTCLTYLSILASQTSEPNSAHTSGTNPAEDTHGLLPYAVQYWSYHYEKARIDEKARQDFCQLFRDEALVKYWSKKFWEYQNPLIRGTDRDQLSIVVEYGCNDLVDVILENIGSRVGSSPGQSYVALGIAIKAGREGLVDKLLKSGVQNARALHFAAAYDRDAIATKLYDHGTATWGPNALGEHPLHIAARCGSLSVVNKLLTDEDNSKVNEKTREGLTPLHLASQFGHFDIVERLLNANADLSSASISGSTPLHKACEWQQPGVVEVLLNKHVNEDVKIDSVDNKKRTPLHIAASTDRADIAIMLLDKASSWANNQLLESQDNDGSTPLHLAVRLSNYYVVFELLKTKSNATGLRDDEGRVPLHLGASNGHLNIVKELLKMDGGQVKTMDHSSTNPIHLAVQEGHTSVVRSICDQHKSESYSLDLFNSSTRTPLHLACEGGYTEIVRVLLNAGARAEITGTYNNVHLYTPLHIACTKGFHDITELLIEFGANPSATTGDGSTPLHLASQNGTMGVVETVMKYVYTNPKDDRGRLPIHLAAQGGHSDVIGMLRKDGVDLNAKDDNQCTILHCASEGGCLEFVKELLEDEFIGKVDTKDEENQTSLHFAARAGKVETVEYLIEMGAEPGAINKQGQTPLQLAKDERTIEVLLPSTSLDSNQVTELLLQAACKGYKGIVQRLLEKDQDSHAISGDDGKSPLAVAAEYGHLGIVQLLLDVDGIEAEKLDKNGRTPLSHAAENGHDAVVEFLLGRGGDPNSLDKKGRSPMSYAAKNGHNAVIKKLADKKVAVDARESGQPTPLWYAADKGFYKTVDLLLDKNADPNLSDEEEEQTSLHRAALNGFSNVATAILHSTRFNSGNEQDKKHRTAMYLAAYYRHIDTLMVLLESKLDMEVPGQYGWTPLVAGYDSSPVVRLLARFGANVNAVDRDGDTALSMAIMYGHDDVVEALLENGADSLIPNNNKVTPLHRAAKDSGIEIIQLMLRCLRSQSIDMKDDQGRSPFLVAVAAGKLEVVRAFLNHGCHVDVRSVDDSPTAVSIAIERGFDDILALLLEQIDRIPSSETPDEINEDLLLLAARRENARIFELLWDRVRKSQSIQNKLFDIAVETDSNWLAGHLYEKAGLSEMDQHGWTIGWIYFVNMPRKEQKLMELSRELPGCDFRYPTSWEKEDKTGKIDFVDESEATGALHIRSIDDEFDMPTSPESSSSRWRRRRFYRNTRRAGIRANHPIPPERLFYFEIKIISQPLECATGLGLCLKTSPLHRMPGWEKTSWGYHGDDGGTYHGGGYALSRSNGEYGTGDYVGCGVDLRKGTAFFTKNGKRLGETFDGIVGRVYPVVGFKGSCEIIVNFAGDTEPFQYDIVQEESGAVMPSALKALQHSESDY